MLDHAAAVRPHDHEIDPILGDRVEDFSHRRPDARLNGANIAFTVSDSAGKPLRFSGTVNGDTIEGTAQMSGSGERRWSARRKI